MPMGRSVPLLSLLVQSTLLTTQQKGNNTKSTDKLPCKAEDPPHHDNSCICLQKYRTLSGESGTSEGAASPATDRYLMWICYQSSWKIGSQSAAAYPFHCFSRLLADHCEHIDSFHKRKACTQQVSAIKGIAKEQCMECHI